MALTSSAIATTNTLEEFRLEFNKLRVDVTALDTADTYVTNIVFEGATTDDYQTTFAVVDPTADRTITLPNLTGTVSLLDATETLTNKTLTTPVIAEIDSGSSITLDATTSITLDAAAGDIALTPASTYDVNIPANIGLTFGDDGEKIEGDGTDLTIASSAALNLTATTDVVVPANVGITFGSGEKIEGNDTDLTVTSGADINLTATGDVNIPSSVGVTFGDDGEKIEGDGTNLTIASSGTLTSTATTYTVDASGDINLDADGGDVFFKDDGTLFGSATSNSGNLIVKSGSTTALTFSGANVTAAGTIASGAITSSGTVTATGFTIGSAVIAEAELEMIDGITAGTATANKAVVLDGSKNIATIGTIGSGAITSSGSITSGSSFIIGSADINETDLEKLDGITNGTAAANKALVVDGSLDIGTIRNLAITGTFSDGNYTFDTSGNVSGLGTIASDAITSTGVVTGTGFTAGSAVIAEAELEMLDGITAGTAAASKAVVLDANKDIGTIRNLTIDGVFTDGNYTFDTSGNVSGLGTIASDAITSTGVVTGTGFTIGSAVIAEAELEMLDGITAGTAAASKALVLDGSTNIAGIGTISSGAITSSGTVTATGFTVGSTTVDGTELGYIDGITAGTAAVSKAVVLDSSKDITGIRNLTLAGDLTVSGTTTTVDSTTINVQNALVFEGATDDAYETTLTTVDPTGSDKTVSLPNATDTLVGKATTDVLTNKTLTSPVLNSTVSGTSIKDEDDMSSDSASHLATQQSIKAYVDTRILTEDTLDELNDTNITSPGDGALLIYDTGTSTWRDYVASGDITISDAGVAAIATGVIVNADVHASAAIADSKLATISTADKVSGAAIQVDGATDGTSVTLAATDKFLVDDAGTTKYVNLSQIDTYVATAAGTATLGDATALAIALG